MPKTAMELKTLLIEQGRWADFVRYREDLKAGGVGNTEAHKRAVAEFFNDPPETTTESGTKHDPKKESRRVANGKKSPPSSDAKVVAPADEKKPVTTVKAPVGSHPPLPQVCSADFAGKVASEVEEVRWVAANMEIADPQPGECPSAAAWGLLAQCRRSPAHMADFWKLTYPKLLPSRAQMEKQQEDVDQEGRAAGVIEDLLRFGQEAVSECGSQ
jgi:hypothetical protein